MKREFKGIWIPAEIWLNKDLNWTEKIMLRENDSLQDDQEGGCYASNGYFSNFFGLSKSRVSEIIKALADKKYVRIFLLRYQERGQVKTRRLVKTTGKGIRKTEGPPSVSRKAYSENGKGYSEKAQYNNTGNNKDKPCPSVPEGPRASTVELKAFLERLGGKCAFPGIPGKEIRQVGGPEDPEDPEVA